MSQRSDESVVIYPQPTYHLHATPTDDSSLWVPFVVEWVQAGPPRCLRQCFFIIRVHLTSHPLSTAAVECQWSIFEGRWS